MTTHVALLRGINLGATNRIPMPALREVLTQAGFENVRTYVQSGNVVLNSARKPVAVGAKVAAVITENFELEIPVVVRSAQELAATVAANPFKAIVTDPKRYQVSFLDRELDADTIERINDVAKSPETVSVIGREIYAWHPDGVARSRLWNELAKRGGLGGATGTARNWTTVTTLLEIARG